MNPSGHYGWGLPAAASSYAHRIDGSLNLLHGVMLLIFFLWGIYLVWCLIRYRRKEGVAAVYSHDTPFSSYIPDVVMLLFEVWLIFMIGIPIWAHIREDLPKPGKSIQVRLVAEQFSWLFHYPGPDGKFGKANSALMHSNNPLGLDENDPDSKDDILSVNELYLPLGQPVLLEMSSKDVVHSFFVPEFRTKQDIVPGMKIPMWFEPTATGKFEIGCAQLCGTGHYRMRGDVIVQSPQEFEEWIQKQTKKGS
ncbi:MAG: hypothetical protein HYY63_03580 [Elusimicrobia bacterium]|nr:hypothetical protein [Elusimicrobiota bacterium]MBI3012685.1 hypothetical protein [Elusimicrobiota bacterium]MBI4218009.1 hypothetical protein [Elusimicrobiota bacterium]